MLWTLLGIAFSVAIFHDPTRQRMEDAISILFSGKTETEKRRERDRSIVATELKIAAAFSGSELSDEKADDMAGEIVHVSEEKARKDAKAAERPSQAETGGHQRFRDQTLRELYRMEEAEVTEVEFRSSGDERATAMEKDLDGKTMTLAEARRLVERHADQISRSVFLGKVRF